MKSIAIIGTGIAGMGAAYFLKDKYDITFFEKNDYPGGHTNTLAIDEAGKPAYIDSAFMVYNEFTYPNLTRLFKELDVETRPTTMSFSVQHSPSGLEYAGTSLNALFAQRHNFLNPRHWKMVLDMDRFCKEAHKALNEPKFLDWTIEHFVKEEGYGRDFLDKFLVPMSSAVWSTPPEAMLRFPIATLVRFFKNHGFLGLDTHYQWRTVVGGSRVYRDKLLKSFQGKVRLNRAALKVVRSDDKVEIIDAHGRKEAFDMAVLACHADEALAMLDNPTKDEKRLLGCFKYQPNKATLHTDSSIMPALKRVWSSWNYRISPQGKPTTIYWMNSLQQVSQSKDYFISINEAGEIDRGQALWETLYMHPLFDVAAIRAQAELPSLNEAGPLFFCGSYFKYGFHEDALTSGLNVAREIRGESIWN